MSLLLANGWVATQNARRDVLRGDVLVEGGRIVAVGENRDGADEVVDCTDCLVLPGLINAHTHVANTLLRGFADDLPLEALLERTFAVDAHFTRRDVQIGALLGCLEMLRCGTTSFVDLFYWEDEVARACTEAGIRGFLAWAVLDETLSTQRGAPVDNAARFVAKHRDRPLVRPWVGLQGVYACSAETFLAARDVATRAGVPMTMHLAETRGEVYDHEAKHGLRPVPWLERIGFLGPGLLAAHCVWVTLGEVRTLARWGTAVAHCPASNMKLASGGVAPVPEFLEAGAPVALATDSPVSNNGLDLVADLRLCALLHKATRWDAAVLPAQRVLDLATIDAARAIGQADLLGSVEPGKRADLAVLRLRTPHAVPFDPERLIAHAVYASTGRDVAVTVVDGRIVMRDGGFPHVDAENVLAQAQEAAAELREAVA